MVVVMMTVVVVFVVIATALPVTYRSSSQH